MKPVRLVAALLLAPFYAGMLINLGRYASALEVAYHPAVRPSLSSPLSYTQDRLSRLLPATPSEPPSTLLPAPAVPASNAPPAAVAVAAAAPVATPPAAAPAALEPAPSASPAHVAAASGEHARGAPHPPHKDH
jgi:hypothetical protein